MASRSVIVFCSFRCGQLCRVVSRFEMNSDESQWSSLFDVVGLVLQSVRPGPGMSITEQPDPAE